MSLYIFNFFVAASGAWVLMKYGGKLGINDIPNQRSSHATIIPKGGGIGILMALVISSLILSIPTGFWLPALCISIVSLWGGDRHCLSPKERMVMQFACSLAFLAFIGYSKEAGFVFALLCLPLSVFIVGTSNFYNFMDGIDGIAGITGVIGFFLLAFYSYINESSGPYSILSIALAFACLGFLCFNLPKAKVFLGDVGSIMLGFVFACLIIVFSEDYTHFIVMSGFLSTFYFDELFTMVVRFRNGDSLILAHRKHVYQLLANELSICHWKIALLYGVIQLMIGLITIYLSGYGVFCLLLFYLICCLIFILVSIKIHKRVLFI